jgi:hypothetical protein
MLVNGFVSVRRNFAVAHLLSAQTLYELAREHESQQQGLRAADVGFQAYFETLRAYVSSTIVLSFASVEANINEFWLDAPSLLPDEFDTPIDEIMESHRFWTLEKYQIALRLAHKHVFAQGKNPYQSVDMLRRLRNAFVHFTPSCKRDEDDRGLAEFLRAHVDLSPYYPDKDDFVAVGCITSSTAKWSLKTAFAFIHGFCGKMGIESKLEKHRARLSVS